MSRHLTCPVCGKEFDTEYNRQKYCSKDCAKIVSRENNKKWKKDNHEHYLETQREYQKNYYKRNPEKFRENSRRYYLKHREKINENSRRYYLEHQEKMKAYQKNYYQKHRGRKMEYTRNYYHSKWDAINKCMAKHDNCFSCPTEDGECLYD